MRFAIRNLCASRVNLQMNDYVAGLPSPMAFLGLAESIGRDLGVDHWQAKILPILHSVHVSEGRTKPEMEPKGGVFTPIETMEDMVGTVDVSLILDLPGDPRTGARLDHSGGRRPSAAREPGYRSETPAYEISGHPACLRRAVRGYRRVGLRS